MKKYLKRVPLIAMLVAVNLQAQTLPELVQRALQNNQALSRSDAEMQAAAAELDRARSEFWPKLSLSSRFYRAEGGRVIELPVGDALNPVYGTLNRLTSATSQPTQFQPIDNPSFNTLREREVDTRLVLQTPVFAPALNAQLALANAELHGKAAQREALARTLVRDIHIAYYAIGRARAALEALRASETVLSENLRVNDRLLAAGNITKDRVLRAQTELLAAQDRSQSARDQAQQGLRYLNFLLAQKLDTALEGEMSTTPIDLASSLNVDVNDPRLQASSARVQAAAAGEKLARASAQPTIGFGLESGIQGEDLGFGSGRNITIAAVNLSCTLFDFGVSKAKQQKATAQKLQAEIAHDETAAQLQLLERNATEQLQSATLRAQTAKSRLQAADASLRIVSKQRDAGSATQIEFLDAERARTEAALSELSARFEQASAAAELSLARNAYPLPARWLAANTISSSQSKAE